MPATDVLVIGAGPYGLSVSAHLRARGVDHLVVGRPMDTWRSHMPAGMFLKSEPYASDMAAPVSGYDLPGYSRRSGLADIGRLGPLALDRFLGYADWYASELPATPADLTVTAVLPASGGGFEVSFADAAPVQARRVVVATGVLPYARIPEELAGLPPELVSHTSTHHDLTEFAGHPVAVIGAGQSALETAALLHEAGAKVQLLVRGQAVSWVDPNPEHLSWAGRIQRPATKLCEGWRCAFWNTPAAFRRLPEDMRVTKARTVLGPSGSWWLRRRVEGVIDVLTGHQVQTAEPSGSGVRLHLDGSSSTGERRPVTDVDHVFAGTGFRIEVTRLPFLPAEVSARITTVHGYPVLSRACESSVPGLYFTGAPAAASLGPSERFIGGTHNSVPHLVRSVTNRSRGRAAADSKPLSKIGA